MEEHKILLISTGGAIAGEVVANKQDLKYAIDKAGHLSKFIKDTLVYIENNEGINLIIELQEYSCIGSSDMTPNNWIDLANIIYKQYDDYDSFVITHGTNTLGYTCAALSFAFTNNAKPIVLTGSQVPIGVPGSDAKINLENAIRIACWKSIPIYGVIAVFGSSIISGTRVTKSNEFDNDAFQTFNTGSLGRICRIIEINQPNLIAHNEYWNQKDSIYPLARIKNRLRVDNRFLCDILSLTELPGMNPNIFKKLVNILKIKGFILRTFGSGDPSTSLIDNLKFLKEEKIPIVITTQTPNANTNMQVNEPGKYILENGLGIPAFDMTMEAQITKLAWFLAKMETKEITYDQLCKEMELNIRGELNAISNYS